MERVDGDEGVLHHDHSLDSIGIFSFLYMLLPVDSLEKKGK